MANTGSTLVLATFLLYLATITYSTDDNNEKPLGNQGIELGLQGRKWCMPKPDTSDKVLQKNIDFACSKGIDCKPIQEGGVCYYPKNAWSHAQYAMNAYYNAKGRNSAECDFNQTGMLTDSDLSYGECVYE